MKKKSTRALASGTLMSLVLTTVLSVGPAQAAAGSVTRTSGLDRYATAAQVAKANWSTGSKDVVLVSGEGYADAVSASALAKQLNAPILLTTSASLDNNAKDALKTLNPTNVYIVGGNASVSEAVRTDLKASNYNLVELQGANRYETNVAVAKKLVELGVKADNVLLVGGEGFSDALSVAPVAAAKGQILLLGNNNEASMKSVIDFVKANSSKVTVVGTSNVISDAIYNAVGAVERVNGGASRFETNMNVLSRFASDLKADKLFVANASGNGYADALVASALAGKSVSPLVLVDAEGTSATTTAINYIKAKATKDTDLNVIGGTGVVSENTVKAIDNIFNPTTPDTTGENTVAEITALNLNQFDVVFNSNVDEDTAEIEENYKVGTTTLDDTNAHAELISDNTVRITLVKSAFNIGQGQESTVSVKKGILVADKTKTVESFAKKIEFKDITAPTIKAASIRGNSKLVVEFSEAVNVKDLTTLRSLIQVNGKTLSSSVEITAKEAATAGTESWTSKVEFYFSTGLNSGENTIKVKDATNGVLVDAAGFSFKEATTTVTVDAVTTAPQVKEITSTDDGEIRVTFDRAMDSKIAVDKYAGEDIQINDSKITDAKIELKENDTVLKITNVPTGILKDNTNILSLTDAIVDAYGNKVEDDTRLTFNKEKDETKPTVLSANILDSKTLRVQFSEDVKIAYATNKDNYELRDAYNVDLMTKAGVIIKAAGADTGNTDTYDITFGNNDAKDILNSSKYTLTIKSIVDTATEPNKMDDYTVTIDGNDDQSPQVEEAFLKDYADELAADKTEIAIFFNKEMDQASLLDKANYYYVDGNSETKDLPEGVDITVSADNKGVVIDFEDANKSVNPSGTGDDVVRKIGIKTVKDVSGNSLYGGLLTIDTDGSDTKLAVQEKTLKLYKDGDDVKAEFQLDTALDTVDAADFALTVTSEDGKTTVAADDADFDGKTVILTFQDGGNADKAEALGAYAKLSIVATGSEDIAGRKLDTELSADQSVVQYNAIAPETDRDSYTATLTTFDVNGTAVKGALVNITMKTPVDADIVNSYKDDFVFISNGVQLDVYNVAVEGNTLVFTVKDATIAADDIIEVTASTDANDIDIRTAADGDGKHVKYVPSTDDMKIKSVTVE